MLVCFVVVVLYIFLVFDIAYFTSGSKSLTKTHSRYFRLWFVGGSTPTCLSGAADWSVNDSERRRLETELPHGLKCELPLNVVFIKWQPSDSGFVSDLSGWRKP